jgi:hypothetical protein
MDTGILMQSPYLLKLKCFTSQVTTLWQLKFYSGDPKTLLSLRLERFAVCYLDEAAASPLMS